MMIWCIHPDNYYLLPPKIHVLSFFFNSINKRLQILMGHGNKSTLILEYHVAGNC